MMTGGHTHSHIRPCGGRLVRIEQNERKKAIPSRLTSTRG